MRIHPSGSNSGYYSTITFSTKATKDTAAVVFASFTMVLGRGAWKLHNKFLAVALITIGISLYTTSSLLKTALNDNDGNGMLPHPPGYRSPPLSSLQSQSMPVSVPAGNRDLDVGAGEILRTSEDDNTIPPSALASNIHIAFSTGCSAGQEWQSYALFHSILQSGQTGHVTRVASGCSEKELLAITAAFDKTIRPMSPDRFHLHTTPNYSKVLPGTDYNFFNKPFGLRHWMQESLGYSSTNTADNNVHDDTVFIILDPDQLIVRPFVQDYTYEKEFWYPRNGQPAKHTAVTRGHPMAQLYGFGTGWMPKVNMSGLFRNETASVPYPYDQKLWNPTVVQQSFVAGPPYMAVGVDMYQIVNTWATIAVAVYQQTKDHLSEMFAYVVAAVLTGLAHQLATSFMVSSVGMGNNEGWPWIDDAWAVADKAADNNNNNKNTSIVVFESQPHIIHYCQRYYLGESSGPPDEPPGPEWFFSKYQLPKDFFSCAHALLKEPDNAYAISQQYNTSITLDGTFHSIPVDHRPRHAYMLHEITVRLNRASVHYKQHHCDTQTDTNWNRSFVFRPKADQRNQGAKKKGTT
jgi:hypothetical protein